jgi:hypothetical protein
MSLLDHRSSTSSGTTNGPSPPAQAELAVGAARELKAVTPSSGRTWLLVLAAGLLAGLAGFGIGEAAPKLVPPSLEFPPEMQGNSRRMAVEADRRRSVSRDQSAAVAYGGLGMVLGLALGAAGGLARRSPRAAMVAGLTGLVMGGAAGAATTVAVLPSYHAARAERTDDNWNEDLLLALKTHGAIWLAVGAASGFALGLGLGGAANVARALVGGILGAALGATIYEFGGAMGFPMAQTYRPMSPEVMPRLMAHLSVALCVAAVAIWAAQYLRLRRTQSPVGTTELSP